MLSMTTAVASVYCETHFNNQTSVISRFGTTTQQVLKSTSSFAIPNSRSRYYFPNSQFSFSDSQFSFSVLLSFFSSREVSTSAGGS